MEETPLEEAAAAPDAGEVSSEAAPLEGAQPSDITAAMETELSADSDSVASEVTGADSAGEIEPEKLKNILEALLFASDEPLTTQTIKDLLKLSTDLRKLRQDILDINKKLQAERRPFEIVEVAGGFQLRTILSYQKYLKGLFKDRAMRRLSGQALETLAIIAYKQPVSRAEIEGIRNVTTDSAMKTLLEKRLIKILGKSEDKPGKPIVYGTTRDFLKYFGLNRISDLPKIEEFEEIAKAQERELIHDFKRDPEKTTTLKPQEVEPSESEEAETPNSEPVPESAAAGESVDESGEPDFESEGLPPEDESTPGNP